MKELEQLNKISNLQDKLESLGYHFMTTRHNFKIEQHDFLVTDRNYYGIMFGSLSFDEEGNFIIFKAVVLGVPSQFVRIHNIIEKNTNF